MVKVISIIDSIDLDITDLFSEKRPVSILISGKTQFQNFLLNLNTFKDWIDVYSEYAQKETGLFAKFLGIPIYCIQVTDKEYLLKDGIYVGYKNYDNIESFIKEINELI